MGEKLNDWAIQIEDELKLMLTNETAEMQQWDKQSIYKVPECFTDLNKKAYKPQFVSFGPYHHEEPHLKPMEKHKHRALLHFLKRSQKPLVSYVAPLAKVAQRLKGSYESLDHIWEADTDRFLMLMILDGCFMLEIMRTSTLQVHYYSEYDPIFSEHGKLHVVPYIRRDMMMLENQLPMLLLTTLVAVEKEEETEVIMIISYVYLFPFIFCFLLRVQQDDGEFHEIVKKLICNFCFPNPWFPYDSSIGKCLHLLDVYRSSLLRLLMKEEARKSTMRSAPTHKAAGRGSSEVIWSSTGGNEVIRSSTEGNKVIRCAMELGDARIRFKKSGSASLDDISFTGGVLSLPPIVVDDTTESTFLNLTAFERFHHVFLGCEVTSYIFFMSKIIESAEDVNLLRTGGIIKNALGSDDDVVKLFNSLSKDLTPDPLTILYGLHGKVNRYWKERRVRVYIMKNYFRNPWAMLSLIAAVFLFFFTLAQTAYTILSYHDPAKNLNSP
ncbi:hypothetical protein RHSIM_Rhsim12G0027000 [Rhododendron simsii]|uniref:Uncharacterized protein n=1 Tax=Rhododendron simsii TaxID=118357 RepID=A0A834G749_RHOSS|nr:hypothetical protein RHSIM_Rhsim12G0027000 [Rhododendron simsii]